MGLESDHWRLVAGENEMSKVPECIIFKEREVMYMVCNVLGCMYSCVCANMHTHVHT